jgi:2,3-bisphosphoglycerate-dependent phosphoglycerate mutase
MMRDLYVVIRPEATHDVDGLVGGWTETPLSERGHRHAADVAHRLRELIGEETPVELLTSDLPRAQQAAWVIGDVLGVQPVALAGLRGRCHGVADGRPRPWLDDHVAPPPDGADRLAHDDGIEGAETRLAWANRVYEAVDQVLASRCRTQVVVTHAGSLSYLVAAWFGIPVEATGRLALRPRPGSLTHLHEDDVRGDRQLLTLDDVSHLGQHEPGWPLSWLRSGIPVRATVTEHHPSGFLARLDDYRPVGASIDLVRRGHEPGVRRLAEHLPEVGTTLDLVVGEVYASDEDPWIWVDLTAPT